MAQQPDLTVSEFITLLNGKGRLLGVDLGTKTIGLAISDSNWFISTPLHVIRRVKFTPDVSEMLAFAEREQITGIIMGLPLNMDETEGPRAQSTRAFVRNMAKLTTLPVLFWDERLSSVEATDAMRAAGLSAQKQKEQIDAFAAHIILESCLVRLCLEREKLAEQTTP